MSVCGGNTACVLPFPTFHGPAQPLPAVGLGNSQLGESPGWGPVKCRSADPRREGGKVSLQALSQPLKTPEQSCSHGERLCLPVMGLRALLPLDWESPRARTVSPWSDRELPAGRSPVSPIRLLAPQAQALSAFRQGGPLPGFPSKWELPRNRGHVFFIRLVTPGGKGHISHLD